MGPPWPAGGGCAAGTPDRKRGAQADFHGQHDHTLAKRTSHESSGRDTPGVYCQPRRTEPEPGHWLEAALGRLSLLVYGQEGRP